jgi:hypothetical protein
MKIVSSQNTLSTFAEFWDHYVDEHQHPVNQLLHVIGTISGIGCIVLAVVDSLWWALAILPVGYGSAWMGHIFIERNLPATLKYPLWSLRADYRLVFRLVTGRPLQSKITTREVVGRNAA